MVEWKSACSASVGGSQFARELVEWGECQKKERGVVGESRVCAREWSGVEWSGVEYGDASKAAIAAYLDRRRRHCSVGRLAMRVWAASQLDDGQLGLAELNVGGGSCGCARAAYL